MEALLGIMAVSALIAGSALLNAAFPVDKKAANWLAVAMLAWSQIVIAATFLSELHAIGLPGFMLWHIAVLALGLIFWLRQDKASLFSLYFPRSGQVMRFIKGNILLVSFVASVALILVLLVLPTTYTESDAAHYHIPRSHYWIQNRTAQHFYTDDIRQIERPPNSSFLYMWQILVTGGYGGLNIMQWLAAVGTALTISALARSAGHSRAASMLAASVYLSLPVVVLQMSAPWNDMLTAFSVATFIYFTIEGVLHTRFGDPHVRSRYLAYAGVAFGLMVGTKHTSLVLLPALGAISMVILLVRVQENFRTLAKLLLLCTAGFFVLGAYNYILNIADFGRPVHSTRLLTIAPADSSESDKPKAAVAVRSILGHLFRYLYQSMDWILVKPLPGADTLYVVNKAVYRGIDDFLNLELESVPGFDIEEFGMRRIRSGEIGFGPLGYALLVTSPFALAIMLARLGSGTQYSTSAFLLILGIGSVVVVAFVRPWTPAQVRYFAPALALLIAAVIPHLYSKHPAALLWLFAIGFLALWTTYQTADAVRGLEDGERALASWQQSILESSLPPDAHIAVSGRVEFIHILEQFPGYRFEPVPRAELLASLLEGKFDAALVLDPDDTYHQHRVPIEHDQSLLVINAREILLANLDKYGASPGSIDSLPVLTLRNSGLIRRIGPDLVQVFLPTAGPVELSRPLGMRMTFPVAAPTKDVLSMVCEGTSLDTHIDGSSVSVIIPALVIDPKQPYQLCRLHIEDLEFGQRIPSSTITVELYPAYR